MIMKCAASIEKCFRTDKDHATHSVAFSKKFMLLMKMEQVEDIWNEPCCRPYPGLMLVMDMLKAQ